MTVLRIVADICTAKVAGSREFHQTLFGLEDVMDFGWIMTLSSDASTPMQLSLASDGGYGGPVPYLSIKVDDVDAIHRRAKAQGVSIVSALTGEHRGPDPSGKLLNVLSHRR